MGDIRFSYNDDFNKTFLRPSQFVADRFLWCEKWVFVVRKYGVCSVKVWFLWCEKWVFAVRKYGVCSVKVWFLWCESMVFVVRKYGVSWVYVCILQFVRSVVADR